MLAQQRKVKMERKSMKILSVSQGYNNKAQKTNQAKGNTNFGAVLVKSHFELFGDRQTLSKLLIDPSGSRPNKITRLINKIRGVDEASDLERNFPWRCQDVYLSDNESREVETAVAAVKKGWHDYCDGVDWMDIENHSKFINNLWEQPEGPVRELRDLAERLLEEGEKNPIEHVVTDCANRLTTANMALGELKYEINSKLSAALNGKKFPVPPKQLEFPFAKEKPEKRYRFGLGGFFDLS